MESSSHFQINKYSFEFPENFQKDFIEILESLNFTQEIIREKLHSLSSDDKIEFIDEFKKGYDSEIFATYYYVKYVRPRPGKPLHSNTLPELEAKVRYLDSFPTELEYLLDKEYQLFLNKNPEISLGEKTASNIYLEYYIPGDYSYTDRWVVEKRKALEASEKELNRIRKSIMKNSPRSVNGLVISEPCDYLSFPGEYRSHDEVSFDYSNFRIVGFKSFHDLTNVLKKDLTSFSERFGQKEMEALVYNSFDFPENRTKIALLNLSNEGVRFKKTIARAVRKIADTAHDHRDIEINEFTQCLFLNFSTFRKTNQDQKQLKNRRSDLSRARSQKK